MAANAVTPDLSPVRGSGARRSPRLFGEVGGVAQGSRRCPHSELGGRRDTQGRRQVQHEVVAAQMAGERAGRTFVGLIVMMLRAVAMLVSLNRCLSGSLLMALLERSRHCNTLQRQHE